MATDGYKKKIPFCIVSLLGLLCGIVAVFFDAWVRYPSPGDSNVDWPAFGRSLVQSHNKIGLVAALAVGFSLIGYLRTVSGRRTGYTLAVAGLFLGLSFLFIFLYRNQIIFPLQVAEAR